MWSSSWIVEFWKYKQRNITIRCTNAVAITALFWCCTQNQNSNQGINYSESLVALNFDPSSKMLRKNGKFTDSGGWNIGRSNGYIMYWCLWTKYQLPLQIFWVVYIPHHAALMSTIPLFVFAYFILTQKGDFMLFRGFFLFLYLNSCWIKTRMIPPQQAHDVEMMLYWRRCDVITSHRRQYDTSKWCCNDVDATSSRRIDVSTTSFRHCEPAGTNHSQRIFFGPISAAGFRNSLLLFCGIFWCRLSSRCPFPVQYSGQNMHWVWLHPCLIIAFSLTCYTSKCNISKACMED